MQWIVDIVKFKLDSYLRGKIFLWSGAVVDIPAGWALCNGTLGTPDLRDKFVPGSGDSYNPNDEGGILLHWHDLVASGLMHWFLSGNEINPGVNVNRKTKTHLLFSQAWGGDTLPTYYSLAFIMKL